MKSMTKLWIGLAILVILSPVGLILPEQFKAGAAWGEWSPEEVKELVGYIPAGLNRLSNIWHALLPDYSLPGQESAPIHALSVSYILSAIVGMAIVVGLTLLLGKLLAKDEQTDSA
ncbi:MAG: PDGLE domain-containing protein [Armatimonadetes bacterium]|nr:PDGLE domain-containing protein [Armatimonadota bacterium]